MEPGSAEAELEMCASNSSTFAGPIAELDLVVCIGLVEYRATVPELDRLMHPGTREVRGVALLKTPYLHIRKRRDGMDCIMLAPLRH